METSDINSDSVMFILFLVIVTGITLPSSSSFVRVFTGDVPRIIWSCRKTIHRLIETSPDREERWWGYSRDIPIFNGIGFIILLILLFLQGFLSFNPQNIRAFDLYTAIKTAISFVTNTNWQVYSGETAVSYLTLMADFTVHNFLSSATGICIAIVVMSGIACQFTDRIGNFGVTLPALP
jgi:K+-transporting ATPase ATPase A chain